MCCYMRNWSCISSASSTLFPLCPWCVFFWIPQFTYLCSAATRWNCVRHDESGEVGFNDFIKDDFIPDGDGQDVITSVPTEYLRMCLRLLTLKWRLIAPSPAQRHPRTWRCIVWSGCWEWTSRVHSRRTPSGSRLLRSPAFNIVYKWEADKSQSSRLFRKFQKDHQCKKLSSCVRASLSVVKALLLGLFHINSRTSRCEGEEKSKLEIEYYTSPWTPDN